MNDKITAAHTDQAAHIYIRQSTPQQVQHNVESNRRPYALKERAAALGFGSVVVVDDDLGVSGAGTQERPGFSRLLAAMAKLAQYSRWKPPVWPAITGIGITSSTCVC